MPLRPLEPLFVRRVALLCCHVARNVAYYHIGYINEDGTGALKQPTEFGATVNDNMLDIAVLEWCKLFADPKARHHWHRIIQTDAEQKQFLAQLLPAVGVNAKGWEQYLKKVRDYRDKFIAHLDEENQMNIPSTEPALKSVFFLYAHLLALAPTGSFDMPRRVKLPLDLQVYFAQCEDEARVAYECSR